MTTMTPTGVPSPSNLPVLDDIDRKLLAELDRDPRAPVVLLAERTGYARGTVQSRLERLTASQVLRPHSTRVQMAALGLPLRGIVMAQVEQDEFVPAIEALRQIPEVIECVGISGRDDLMCQVGARDPDHLYLVSQRMMLCPGIRRTATSLVLREFISQRTDQLL